MTLHLYHSLANSVAVACHQSAIGQFCYISKFQRATQLASHKVFTVGTCTNGKNDCNSFRWLINMQNFAFHRFSHDVLQLLSYSCTEQVFSPWWCWNSRLVWVGVASHLTSHYRDRLQLSAALGAHRCQKAPCLVMYSSKTSSGHSLQSLQETIEFLYMFPLPNMKVSDVRFFPQTS